MLRNAVNIRSAFGLRVFDNSKPSPKANKLTGMSFEVST